MIPHIEFKHINDFLKVVPCPYCESWEKAVEKVCDEQAKLTKGEGK